MKKTFWVLMETYNQYDQYGDYLIAVWSEKPTIEQLMQVSVGGGIGHPSIATKILETGSNEPEHKYGGDSWYTLSELEEGTVY